MPVSADHAAVQADVARLKRRDGGQLGGEEILLRDAVIVVQQREDGELHTVLALVGIRHAADQQVQPLARNALGHRLFHLIRAEMRQQIGDDELRIVRVAADDHVDQIAVFQRDDAVQLQRDRHPLVFLDAAVVVRLEIGHLRVLIQRKLLEIQLRGVHVRTRDHTARAQRLASHHSQHQRLAAVTVIHLRTRLECHAIFIRYEPGLLCQPDGRLHSLALGARRVQKLLIPLAVRVGELRLLRVDPVISVLLFVKELFAPFFMLAHAKTSCITCLHVF